MTSLAEVLHRIRPKADFTTSRDFIGEGLLDSLDLVALIAALNHTYRISIQGGEVVVEDFQNLESLAGLLKRHGVQLHA
jgi:acyl carrier protein